MIDKWVVGMILFTIVFVAVLFPDQLGLCLGLIAGGALWRLLDWFLDIKK